MSMLNAFDWREKRISDKEKEEPVKPSKAKKVKLRPGFVLSQTGAAIPINRPASNHLHLPKAKTLEDIIDGALRSSRINAMSRLRDR